MVLRQHHNTDYAPWQALFSDTRLGIWRVSEASTAYLAGDYLFYESRLEKNLDICVDMEVSRLP